MNSSFDIIGDVHGQSSKLEALLRKLGYRHQSGAWRHPSRRARFVGDLIDRGPGQLETLRLVRAMVDAGTAEMVMGNHEFNAIAFATQHSEKTDVYLRPRNRNNVHQHQAFLDAVGLDSPEHKMWIKWFMTLPLWIEDDNMRLVHACWHEESLLALSSQMSPGNTLNEALVEKASNRGSPEYIALENICKGLEIDLPGSIVFTDAQGVVRSRTRTRWWDNQANTIHSAALLSRAEADQLPHEPLLRESLCVYDDKLPVFFGHYWFTGSPKILSSNMCCVDYSAARDREPLVAYRFDGERELSNDKLVVYSPNLSPEIIVASHFKKR